MKATAKSTGIEGRIVNLSSVAHHHTYPKGIDFEKLNDEKTYVPLIYGPLWGLTVIELQIMMFYYWQIQW